MVWVLTSEYNDYNQYGGNTTSMRGRPNRQPIC